MRPASVVLMSRSFIGVLPACLTLTALLSGCGSPCSSTRLSAPGYAVTGVSIFGPDTITAVPGSYVVYYLYQGAPGFTGPAAPNVLLKDVDRFLGIRTGTRILSWDTGGSEVPLTAPPDAGIGYATLALFCDGDNVSGSATTRPNGDPNNPNSGERNAEVFAEVNEFCTAEMAVTCVKG